MADEGSLEDNLADIDFSIIRTSLEIGGKMIEQILKGVHYGSPEVRCLLLDECDLIIECKVCRALFRALPNFIAHKRIYCTRAFQETQPSVFDILPEDETVVVQPTAPEDYVHVAEETSTDKTAEDLLQQTVSQIQDGSLGKSEEYQFYTKAVEKVEKQKQQKKILNMKLTPITSNPNAVHVTMGSETFEKDGDKSMDRVRNSGALDADNASDTAELMDISAPAGTKSDSEGTNSTSLPKTMTKISPKEKFESASEMKSESLLKGRAEKKTTTQVASGSLEKTQPCGKMNLRTKEQNKSNASDDIDEENQSVRAKFLDLPKLKCLKCNTTYSSRKTLLYHYQMRHSGLRTFFPCPYCSNVFFYFWGLTRHLMKNHKKSKLQINRMRAKLRSSSFKKNVTKPCIQAKDQLEYTVEEEETDAKSPKETSKDSKTVPKDNKDSRSRKKDSPDNSKKKPAEVVSKAIIKQTTRNTSSKFACRPVPPAISSFQSPLPTKEISGSAGKGKKMQDSKLAAKETSESKPSPVIKVVKSPKKPDTPKKSENLGQATQFPSGFKLFNCQKCSRVFGKKISLENHLRSCLKSLSDVEADKKAGKDETKGQKVEVKGQKNDKTETTESQMEKSSYWLQKTRRKSVARRLRIVEPEEMDEIMEEDVENEVDSKSKEKDGKKDKKDEDVKKDKKQEDCRNEKKEEDDKKGRKEEVKKEKEDEKEEVKKGKTGEVEKDKKENKEDEVWKTVPAIAVGVSTRKRSQPSSSYVSQPPEKQVRIVEEIWIHKQPGKPSEKVKSNRIYVTEADKSSTVQCLDTKKLDAIVDEQKLRCQKCMQDFSSVSNLRRHAIRHLGWKRYKCKMCRFSSYNKSECNTHILRTHSDKYRSAGSVDYLVVDLSKEGSKVRNMKKQQTLSEKHAASRQDRAERYLSRSSPLKISSEAKWEKAPEDRRKPAVREENITDPQIGHFNISTRNSPRNFDTRPYKKVDRMATLFTRKGYYPKPSPERVAKSLRRSGHHDDSSQRGGDTDDDTQSTISQASEHSGPTTQESSVSRTETVSSVKKGEQMFEKPKQTSWDSILDQDTGSASDTSVSSKKSSVYSNRDTKVISSSDEKGATFSVPHQSKSVERMTAMDMFALIRRSPRAGSGGTSKRKSSGDTSTSGTDTTKKSVSKACDSSTQGQTTLESQQKRVTPPATKKQVEGDTSVSVSETLPPKRSSRSSHDGVVSKMENDHDESNSQSKLEVKVKDKPDESPAKTGFIASKNLTRELVKDI